jgi:hypothetical protein
MPGVASMTMATALGSRHSSAIIAHRILLSIPNASLSVAALDAEACFVLC